MFEALVVAVFFEISEHEGTGAGGEAVVGPGEAGVWGKGAVMGGVSELEVSCLRRSSLRSASTRRRSLGGRLW